MRLLSNVLHTCDDIHLLASGMVSGDRYSSPNVTLKDKPGVIDVQSKKKEMKHQKERNENWEI